MTDLKEFTDFSLSREQKKGADMTFYAAGWQQTRPGHRYGPIVRNYHVIHFVLSGKGRVHIRGRALEVNAGQAFLLPAQVPHFYETDSEDPWQYCWISFLGLQSSAYLQMIQNASADPLILDDLDCQAYARQILAFLDSGSEGLVRFFEGAALLNGIMARLMQDLHISEPRIQSHPMEDVKYFIDMNIGLPLSVHSLAAKFGYHLNYLVRKFRETFHISPKQYIQRAKLNKARTMLEQSAEPVTLIAASLGYPDPASFSRAFKNFFGVSPASVRSGSKNAADS